MSDDSDAPGPVGIVDDDADIRTDGGALYINVAGRDYGPDAALGLDLTVGDCLLG